MANVGMQFEETRAVASKYRGYSGQIEELIRNLKTSQEQLQGNWQGSAFEQFEVRFNELVPNVQSFENLLVEISEYLDKSANLLEEADMQMKNAIK